MSSKASPLLELIPLGSFVTVTPMALAYRCFREQAKLTALQVIAYPHFTTPGQPPRSPGMAEVSLH